MRAHRYEPSEYQFGYTFSGAVRALVLSNLAVFIVQLVANRFGGDTVLGRLVDACVLDSDRVFRGEIWRLGTYLFLHGGWQHLIFNMFGLWMFGAQVEQFWGSTKFLRYYFFTGVGAGLCTFLFPHSRTIGASGAIYGVIMAFVLQCPDRPVLLYFILPVRAKVMAWGYALISLIPLITDALAPAESRSGVSHLAHLGGFAFGWIYVKGLPFRAWYRRWQLERRKRRFKVLEFRDAGKDDWGRPTR